MLEFNALAAYWSRPVLEANALVFMHLLGALLLGMLVGYERSYHGRAAGMRTYGLVCMASAGVAVIGGLSHYWYGGQSVTLFTNGDLSRVIQGVLTGIGFLCAGVIMKEGFNISGLTTAASLWASSVIGVLVGVGLYAGAIALALLSAFCMIAVSRLERWLPSHQAVAISLTFEPGFRPMEAALRDMAAHRGYDIAPGSLTISMDTGGVAWSFVAVARRRKTMKPITELSDEMSQFPGVLRFHIAHART